MKKRTTEVNLIIGFVVTLLLLLLAGVQMYRSLQEYRVTLRWVEHTHLVLRTINSLTSAMYELESGQRGYIISREETFFTDYNVTKSEIRKLQARIGQLTIDNPVQHERSAALLLLVEKRLALLDKTIDAFHSQSFAAVHDLVRMSRSTMDSLRKLANSMETEERTLLQERNDKVESNARNALTVGTLLLAVALTGFMLLLWREMSEAKKRRVAEEVLHESEQQRQVVAQLQEKNVELDCARSEAESANLAKSEFLSSMSHELRSPLNAILGFAQLMESDSPPPTPSQKESIAQILQAGWHLLTLINEILDLAKVESRQTPLSNEPVSLSEVMLECQGMIEPQAQARGIRITFPRLDEPCFVMADRTRVKQVLINLLSNAIKYNIRQGEVEVKCTAFTPGRVRMSISDTGNGLRPDQVEHLFQAFNRLGQEAGGEEGTGIGLVVAKRLVELMGGFIGVESTVGVGSVFWFELSSVDAPHLIQEEYEERPAAQPQVLRDTRFHTILYVEDNPANLMLVEQIISRHPGIRMLSAKNGNSGIEIARVSLPDVILMDINMPGISGLEALHILRSDPHTAHIPVIAVTANAMPLDVEKGLKAGFFSYVTKPIKVNEFMEALNKAIDHAGKKTDGST